MLSIGHFRRALFGPGKPDQRGPPPAASGPRRCVRSLLKWTRSRPWFTASGSIVSLFAKSSKYIDLVRSKPFEPRLTIALATCASPRFGQARGVLTEYLGPPPRSHGTGYAEAVEAARDLTGISVGSCQGKNAVCRGQCSVIESGCCSRIARFHGSRRMRTRNAFL